MDFIFLTAYAQLGAAAECVHKEFTLLIGVSIVLLSIPHLYLALPYGLNLLPTAHTATKFKQEPNGFATPSTTCDSNKILRGLSFSAT